MQAREKTVIISRKALFFILFSLLTCITAQEPGHAFGADATPDRLTCPEKGKGHDFFLLNDGRDLREMGGDITRKKLTLVRSKGSHTFGQKEGRQYCALRKRRDIQWVLSDLETGDILSQSKNAKKIFFGASASKIFVAAALLNKQKGKLTPSQFRLMTQMIVVSSNTAWLELQKQAGDGESDDSGREAVDRFTRKMGYENIRGFQGWWRESMHGNELNALALSRFLFDTYHNTYPGAEILWKLMYACKTGTNKGNYYMPKGVYIGGKTGTYHGPNTSPRTMAWETIMARNHVMIFNMGGRQYGLSILSNRGKDRDVAILAGGLVREYIGEKAGFGCSP
ncbi:MAG: serine hydrolase [Deltaproteobacteria bacterium]|nr:serine hydrolase [Deltaproteobacteria bacterium]